jgi:hypothetical protein
VHEPLLDHAYQLLEAEVRHAGGVEDAHPADVTPGGVGLGGEEDGVAVGKLLHGGLGGHGVLLIRG